MNSSQAKKRIACKLMEGYTFMGNGEVCLRCRIPLMVDNENRNDNYNDDNCGREPKGTGICVVCQEECVSAAEFERKLVMFSAMQAQLTVEDDENEVADDHDDNSKAHTNNHVKHGAKRGYDVEKSIRLSDDVGDKNDESLKKATADEGGVTYMSKLWNSETDGDDNDTLVMDDLLVLSNRDEDALMNIEVTLRQRCKSCGMDIENLRIVNDCFYCPYCHVAPKLDSEDESGSSVVSVSSILGNFLQKSNVDLLNVGLTLKLQEQEEEVEHPPEEETSYDIRKEEKLQGDAYKNTSSKIMMMDRNKEGKAAGEKEEVSEKEISDEGEQEEVEGPTREDIVRIITMMDSREAGATHINNSSSKDTIYQQRRPNDDKEREDVGEKPKNLLLVTTKEATNAANEAVAWPNAILGKSQSQVLKKPRTPHPINVVLVCDSKDALPSPNKTKLLKSHLIAKEDIVVGDGGGGGGSCVQEDNIEVLQPLVETMSTGSCCSALTFSHDFPSDASNQNKHNSRRAPLSDKTALIDHEHIVNASAISSSTEAVPSPRINKNEFVKSLIAKFWQENNDYYRERIDPPERSRSDPPTIMTPHIGERNNSADEVVDQELNCCFSTSGLDPPEETKTISTITLRYIPTAADTFPQFPRTASMALSSCYDVVEDSTLAPSGKKNNDVVDINVSPEDCRRIARREDGSSSSCDDSFYNKWRAMRDNAMSSVADTPSVMDSVDIRDQLEQLEFEFSHRETKSNTGRPHTSAELVNRPSCLSLPGKLSTICEDTSYAAIPSALHPIGNPEHRVLNCGFSPCGSEPSSERIASISRDHDAKRESCDISNTLSPSLMRYGPLDEFSFSQIESPSYTSIDRGVAYDHTLYTSEFNQTSRHSGSIGNDISHKSMSVALQQNGYHDTDYSRVKEAPQTKQISSLSPTAAARRQRYKEHLIATKSSLSVQSPSFHVSIE
jgi:hypothetical protein